MENKKKSLLVAVLIGLMIVSGCRKAPVLKELSDNQLIGGALGRRLIEGDDAQSLILVETHFNTITPENDLKWERVHPEPDRYDFEVPDRFVALGEKNNMFVVGHVLVWHAQTPRWVFQDEARKPATAEILDKRMRDHILTVAGRYKGRIHGWDVVNEAFEENGDLRKSPWLRIMGEDYLAKAFTYAREADPEAELYYNDYNLWKPEKRDGVVREIRKLKEQGVPVDGIGMQGHWGMQGDPSVELIEEAILAYSEIVDKIVITELDINVLPAAWDKIGADLSKSFELQEKLNPYTEALPDSMQQKLSDRYAELFALFQKHADKISRVTFWGVADGASWLNNFPVRGRTAYPLLWDREYQPKPAFDAVVKTLKSD